MLFRYLGRGQPCGGLAGVVRVTLVVPVVVRRWRSDVLGLHGREGPSSCCATSIGKPIGVLICRQHPSLDGRFTRADTAPPPNLALCFPAWLACCVTVSPYARASKIRHNGLLE